MKIVTKVTAATSLFSDTLGKGSEDERQVQILKDTQKRGN
jgi:hypothetical protein